MVKQSPRAALLTGMVGPLNGRYEERFQLGRVLSHPLQGCEDRGAVLSSVSFQVCPVPAKRKVDHISPAVSPRFFCPPLIGRLVKEADKGSQVIPADASAGRNA